MNKWKIDITLKSGITVSGIRETTVNNSTEVMRDIFKDQHEGSLIPFRNADRERSQLFVNVSEIAAIVIY